MKTFLITLLICTTILGISAIIGYCTYSWQQGQFQIVKSCQDNGGVYLEKYNMCTWSKGT